MQGKDGPHDAAPAYVATIVFHVDADSTVRSSNASKIVEAAVGRDAFQVHHAVPGKALGHSSTRTLHRGADGHSVAEQWTVHGCAHGWSGRMRQGTFTDERGSDASGRCSGFSDHP